LHRVFIGYDPRQPLAYNVLQHSIVRHSSEPVSITPLILSQLPIKRRGLTEFTYSRFLVPWLCGYAGHALFLDADMVVTGDISELFNAQPMEAVSVMQQQPKFEWASAMLFNAGCCRKLTPWFIDDAANPLFDLAWAPYVGNLAPEWNHCVGYMEPKEAKLYHYTQGLPCFYETAGMEEDAVWNAENDLMSATVEWKELMGNSTHAKPVLQRLIKRYAA
jgi:hypothetical protein